MVISSNTPSPPQIRFVANGLLGTRFAGGDLHFLKLAEGLLQRGCLLRFLGCHAANYQLQHRNLHIPIDFTDTAMPPDAYFTGAPGKYHIFSSFAHRLRQALAIVRQNGIDDIMYAVSDYWVDVLPVIHAHARRKAMILHMLAPSFKEALARPNITERLAALHHCLNQRWVLRQFRDHTDGTVFYIHPALKDTLVRMGYDERRLCWAPLGLDLAIADAVPPQPKQFDVAWIGRDHPQKGVDDLLEVLANLSRRLPHFRAVLMGDMGTGLQTRLSALGLQAQVTLAGFVDGEQKFQLLKASRVFIMPSLREGWPAVIGEALICGTPVVGYELDGYRTVTGPLMKYVARGNRMELLSAVERAVTEAREGTDSLPSENLAAFRHRMSRENLLAVFCNHFNLPTPPPA